MPVLAPSLSTGGDRQAYATLVTSDSYVIGALVLAASLREHSPGSAHVPIVVLHAPTLSAEAIEALQTAFDVLVPIAPLHSGAHGRDARNLQLLGRPELDVTYSKLHVWTLTDYDKVVFLDADTLVCDGVEALFGYNELAAAPDCGWPDIFNSGVFVLRPSTETFDQLVAFAAASGSWDGADQGLLNDFFAGSWNRIPFVYNVTPTSVYTYAPAFQRFQGDIKIVHFAGPNKPWTYAIDPATGAPHGKSTSPDGSVLLSLVGKWWAIFSAHSSAWSAYLGLNSKNTTQQGHGRQDLHSHSGSPVSFGAVGYAGSPTGSGASFRLASGMSTLDPSRYSFPAHELDEAELENWKRAMSMTEGGRRRESFRRRRPSAAARLSDLSPPGTWSKESEVSAIDSARRATPPTPKSPKTPALTPLDANFADALASAGTPASPFEFGTSASPAFDAAAAARAGGAGPRGSTGAQSHHHHAQHHHAKYVAGVSPAPERPHAVDTLLFSTAESVPPHSPVTFSSPGAVLAAFVDAPLVAAPTPAAPAKGHQQQQKQRRKSGDSQQEQQTAKAKEGKTAAKATAATAAPAATTSAATTSTTTTTTAKATATQPRTDSKTAVMATQETNAPAAAPVASSSSSTRGLVNGQPPKTTPVTSPKTKSKAARPAATTTVGGGRAGKSAKGI